MNTAVAQESELVITRVFNAPREVVFNVWTMPEHITRWWGPNDFTLPFCEMDFREGGSYKYCMRSPDGEDHWVWGKYREITRPERIVLTWEREDPAGNPRSSSVVHIKFEDDAGKTKFTLVQSGFASAEDCAEHLGGWTECMDRLTAYVERDIS